MSRGGAIPWASGGGGGGGVADGDYGDVEVTGGGGTWTINPLVISTGKLADDAVTFAKIQNIDTKRLIGRDTAGTGSPEEVTASEVLDWLGTAAQGAIAYRGAAGWVLLDAATDGYVLTTHGAGADPTWEAPGGGTFPGVYGFDLTGSSTSAGYTSNRTTAGSYASYTATAILLVPIEGLTVVWDAFPGTWDLSINGVSYGTQVSAGSPATLTWTLPAGTRFLTSVAFTFTRSAGTSQIRDASSQTKYLAHWIWAKDAEYGGSTFTFTPAISMTYVPATLAELV
jgi:hypothetical protein